MSLAALLTATKISDAISSVDGHTEDQKKAARIRLKLLTSKRSFLVPEEDPNAGQTSAKFYRKRELARAAILIDAVEAGFEGQALDAIASALKAKVRFDTNNDSALDRAIATYFESDETSVRWLLTLSYVQDRANGSTYWTATVLPYLPSEPSNPKLGDDQRFIVRCEFDLTARLAPFGWMLREA